MSHVKGQYHLDFEPLGKFFKSIFQPRKSQDVRSRAATPKPPTPTQYGSQAGKAIREHNQTLRDLTAGKY